MTITMTVIMISTEVVQPASPTPSHLRRYNRSFIDQTSPTNMMPTIFYYPPPTPDNNKSHDPIAANAERIRILKRSLSEILCFYYPFAGRATDPLFIDCNDAGVDFALTHVNRCLSDVVSEQNGEELSKLLLYPDVKIHDYDRLLGVQANVCTCGGLAVGVSWSHNICDGLCFANIMNSWAGLARGDNGIARPTLNAASLFPPIELPKFPISDEAVASFVQRLTNVATKVFRFSGASISSLKDKYAKPDLNPTGVEALSTFIWTRFYESSQKQSPHESKARYIISQAVNLRNRGDPPGLMLNPCIGNICHSAVVQPDLEEESVESGYGLVKRMRQGIKKLDGEYIKKLKKGDGRLYYEGVMEAMKERTVIFAFSSMNRFPFYDADFGWGRPVWVSSGYFEFCNHGLFYPTESGDGVEVWLSMKEEHMKKLEVDHQFLKFHS